jgi:hypothetical protein
MANPVSNVLMRGIISQWVHLEQTLGLIDCAKFELIIILQENNGSEKYVLIPNPELLSSEMTM